jgi:hypothetical protein
MDITNSTNTYLLPDVFKNTNTSQIPDYQVGQGSNLVDTNNIAVIKSVIKNTYLKSIRAGNDWVQRMVINSYTTN